MFVGDGGSGGGGPSLSTGDLAGWRQQLAGLDRDVSDAERIEQIRVLEELKAAAAAAQARVSAGLDASQRAAQAVRGVPADRQGAGVAAQVGLARRESPHTGARHLGLAKILVAEMPHTLAALAAGRINEWRATLLARETGCLSAEHRALVDELIAGPEHLGETERWGDARLVAEARKLAYRLDPHAFVKAQAKAESDRTVSLRPAPDTMAYLTGLLPVAQAVACHAALKAAADSARAAGDERSRGQVMADTLVERLTGQATAGGTPVEVDLVITDQALLGAGPGAEEPAHLVGSGPVPASWARRLLADLPAHTKAWVRRLYAHPVTGELVAMDSRRRSFDPSLRKLIGLRDVSCRTPWCDAPIRHTDHVVAYAEGGDTSAGNGQGLCEACNYAKAAPGWQARPALDRSGRHTVTTTTPTGHHYRSTAPPLPGTGPPEPPQAPAPAPVPTMEARAAPGSWMEIYYPDFTVEYVGAA
jgi:hypothetical protein